MLPNEFDLLCWRREVELQNAWGPTALLASIYVNAHLPEGESKVKPTDFIPGMAEPKPTFEPGVIPITADELKRQWSAGISGRR